MSAKTITEKLAAGLALAQEVGDCLEWQSKFSCKGVTPVVGWYDPEKNRTENEPVTRLLWERKNGPIPAGQLVYRTCCNNACVLEDHIKCGTRKDWVKARKKAGATKHSPAARIALTLGARRRSNVKNTIDKARKVRSLAAGDMSVDAISQATGVHPAMVCDIQQGRAWREIGGNIWQGLGA